jgi:hypothetical protein
MASEDEIARLARRLRVPFGAAFALHRAAVAFRDLMETHGVEFEEIEGVRLSSREGWRKTHDGGEERVLRPMKNLFGHPTARHR